MTAATPSVPADIGSGEADLDPSTDRYARRFEGPAGRWLLARQTEILRDLMRPFPQAHVLDIGGGHGQVAGPLSQDGHRVQVRASSDRALGHTPNLPGVETATGSLTDLPYGDRSFDVVTSFRIMAHIGDWPCLLREACRVARRGVIIDFPIPGGANALEPLLFGLKKRIEGDTRRFQSIRKHDVRAVFSGEGYHDILHFGQFVLPMVVHRKLKRPGLSGAFENGLSRLGLATAVGSPVILRAMRDGTS